MNALLLAAALGLAPAPPSFSAADALALEARCARQLVVAWRARASGAAPAASPRGGVPFRTLGSLATDLAVSATPAPLADVWLLETPDAATADALHASLDDDPAVAWVERNAPRAPLDAPFPDDPMFRDGRQWGLEQRGVAPADVRASAAWRHATGSDHVRLAIADTGLDPAHPELGGALADGRPRLVDGINVTLVEPASAWADSFGHGTPVAGVMAARTHDGAHGAGLGVAGVCGGDGHGNAGCRIVPIKIAPGATGGATSFAIARAILHATAVGARALNLSFGGSSPSRLERAALHHAIARGTVVVAAAGNGGAAHPTRAVYPAAYARDGLCIQVGAADTTGARAPWSSFGPGLDLLAPGVDVWTTFMSYPTPAGYWPGLYVRASGTSFAAPFATGTIGLIATREPRLRDSNLQRLLRATARDAGAPGVDAETGAGLLDAGAALAALDGIGVWHDEVAARLGAATGADSLRLDTGGIALFDLGGRGTRRAIAWEAFAEIAIPDSFVGEVAVWPRVAGTTVARGGFEPGALSPWAEARPLGARRWRLSGTLYRVEADSTTPWLPLPPELARFGFTVIGRVAPPAAAPHAGRGGSPLVAAPNPFVTHTSIRGAAGPVVIHDVRGRRVRVLEAASGVAAWDGRDAAGRAVGPGLYFARAGDGARLRVLKLR